MAEFRFDIIPEVISEAEGTALVMQFTLVDGTGPIPEGGVTVNLEGDTAEILQQFLAPDGDGAVQTRVTEEGNVFYRFDTSFGPGAGIVGGVLDVFSLEDGDPDQENSDPEAAGTGFLSNFSFTITDPIASITLPVSNDLVQEADQTFTYTLVEGEGYTVDGTQNSGTFTVTDGVTPATTPTVGITVSPENPTNTDLINLYESDQTVVTAIFTVDGPIPPEGLLVELAGPPRSIAEFDVNATNPRLPEAETVVEGVVVTGGSIVGTDEVAGSLIIRITEATATVAVPVFQDDEVEGREEFLFEIVDGEQYEVDPDADSIRVFIDDINGYREGDSANFVTPPPMYEGGLSDGEQANADFVDLLEGQALLDELQAGGYVVYIRHAQTERDFADQVTADVDDFSTQRVVSEFGVKQSLVIGEGFRNSEIPVAQVITSDYGRAVETAAIAFGEYEKNSDLNFLPVEDYTPEDIEEMRANVTPFLTAVPEDGTNTVIVAHDDLFEAGTGIYPDPQGIAYVIDPDGGQDGGLQVVANLLPEEWAALSDGVSGSSASVIPASGDGLTANGWTPGDAWDLVTPAPDYGGEQPSDGEQANLDFVDQLEGAALLTALQEGGLVVYFRHASTEIDFADQATDEINVNDFSTQRVLSEFGIQQSLAIGEGFERSEIPVGDVITSDYGRAIKTAAIAFPEYEKNSKLNFLPFEDYTPEQVEQMRANVTPFLTEVPEDGTNTVLVGHDDLFESATGIYPDPQGIAYVIDPDGGDDGGFELIANLLPEEWIQLSTSVPEVSFSTTPGLISEADGDSLVLNFSVTGAIPEGGITVNLEGDTAEILQQFLAPDGDGAVQTRVTDEGNVFYRFDTSFGPGAGLEGGTLDVFSLEDGDPDQENSDPAAAGTGFLSDFSFTITEPTASITLPVSNDLVQEPDQTFTYTLASGVGYTVNDTQNSGTFTVTDGIAEYPDSPTVGVTATPTTLIESEQTAIEVTFNTEGTIPAEGLVVQLQGPPRAIAEFDINNVNVEPRDPIGDLSGVTVTGGSIVGTDEVAGSLFLLITDPTATVTVPVFDDDVEEGAEVLPFTLVDGEEYEVDPDNSAVSVVIQDEPPTVSIEITPSVVTEDGQPPTFDLIFTVDGDIPDDDQGVVVTLAGSDFPTFFGQNILDQSFGFVFEPVDGIVGIANRGTEFDLGIRAETASITFALFDDILREESLTFDFEVLEGEGYNVGDGSASITIEDGDIPPLGTIPVVSLSVSETELVEGQELTVFFDVDETNGVIPPEGLQVFVSSGPTDVGEFVIFGPDGIDPDTDLVGIAGFPEQGDINGGFFVTVVEPQASITLSVFDDGPNEGLETLDFSLVDGELYEVDPDNAGVTLNIDDTAPALVPNFGSLDGDTIEGVGSNELTFGGAGDDLIDTVGGTGGNRLYGQSGDDTFILGSDDRALGGAGDDRFFLLGGDNTITGGQDMDQFWIAVADIPPAANTITDFESGEDVIGVAGLGIGFDELGIAQQGDDTLISFGDDELAKLLGVTASDLTAADFAFADSVTI